MREFEDLVRIRDETVAGVGPWHWLKSDSGAWDGPKTDWENHHSQKWFKNVRDWTCCIQAGACQGMYPRLLSERFATVYAFEPDRINFHVANLNCQTEKIFLFNAAVGRASGTFTGIKREYMDNVGMHKTEGQGPIPIVAIDSLNLPVCGLLALDIEGYEYEAIQGAVGTIQRCRPVVVLERPGQAVRQILYDLGYEDQEDSMSDLVFVVK